MLRVCIWLIHNHREVLATYNAVSKSLVIDFCTHLAAPKEALIPFCGDGFFVL